VCGGCHSLEQLLAQVLVCTILLKGAVRHALQVSQIIAPAVLAVYTLNLSRISVMDTATLLFGYFLAEKLEPPSLFWGFIATLVAAVYYGYGALSFCYVDRQSENCQEAKQTASC